MISTDKTNKKANKGYIWRIPLVFLDIYETHPLFITHVCISVYNGFAQLMKDSMSPKSLEYLA